MIATWRYLKWQAAARGQHHPAARAWHAAPPDSGIRSGSDFVSAVVALAVLAGVYTLVNASRRSGAEPR
jgi:hypothetical protein